MTQSAKTPFLFALLLAMSMALGPLALDTYLPAFPAMAQDLGVNIHEVSLSISIYVFMLALGQLVAGPMADKLGRQWVMLSGLVVFAGSSLAISQIHSIEWLLGLRALQAFGAGWTAVCVPALIRDRMSGREAAKFFSLIGLIMIIAPAIAPSIGSALLLSWGWVSIFIFLGGYALLMVVLLKLNIFNRDYQHVPTVETLSVLQRYQQVLKVRSALPFIFLGALSFSVMLIFITHSAFIYQGHFGVGPTAFSLLFGANIVLMVVMNLLNRRLLDQYAPEQILRWALMLQFGGLVYLLAVCLLMPSLWWFLPGMIVAVGSMGAVMPNIQASYMEFFPHNGGTAAALFGAVQFSLSGTLSAFSALLPETLTVVVMSQLSCSVLCMGLLWFRAQQPKSMTSRAVD